MTIRIHKKEDRGQMDYGWLYARYSFSFANYFNPERIGFGALKVLNNDTIAPGRGFDTHCHRDFEIITIPLDGAVKHEDNKGNSGIVNSNQVQVMSAGTGICHSEYNASESEPLELFQIWIETDTPGVEPRYQQADIPNFEQGTLVRLVGSMDDKDAVVTIHQNAQIAMLTLEKNSFFDYHLESGRGLFVMTVNGVASVDGQDLLERDSAEIQGVEQVTLTAEQEAKLLLIEVPLN